MNDPAGYIIMGMGAIMIGFLVLVVIAAVGWFIVPIALGLLYLGKRT